MLTPLHHYAKNTHPSNHRPSTLMGFPQANPDPIKKIRKPKIEVADFIKCSSKIIIPGEERG